MNNKEIKIEPLSDDTESIKKVAELHKLLFDKDHFTANFSERMLYDYFQMLFKNSSFKYKALVDNQYVGYLIAGINLDDVLVQFSKRNFIRLLYLTLKYPKFIKEKLQDYFRKSLSKNLKSKAEMRLFLIAAKHSDEIKGIGKKLINQLEEDLVKNHISFYGLSVRKHNSKAIDFYKQLGFIEEFRTNKSIYFIKNLQKV